MKTEAALGLSVVPVFAYQSLKKINKKNTENSLIYYLIFCAIGSTDFIWYMGAAITNGI